MPPLPPDHADRFVLADEVHARPPLPLDTPSRASYVALLVDAEDRPREQTHLMSLCERFGVAPPAPGVTHFVATIGPVRMKWERHGEFSGYTFFADGASPTPFAEPAASRVPPGWLRELPGTVLVAAHAEVIAGDPPPWAAGVPDAPFDGHIAVGADIGDGAGRALTDFRIHADGFSRFVLLNRGFTPRQVGRMLQRLFEIEAYRMLALLALPIARRQAPRIVEIEKSLVELTGAIALDSGGDEALLQALSRLAAEVESSIAASQFRFGACRAYSDLVTRRIAELRETRIPGIQTIDEFMARRFTPAVATCATTSQRLRGLSERVAQASALLTTRVSIARERQNQALLASMDRRAKLQLRLQQTVEGLSVAAITYYAVGLVGYVGKALKSGGLPVNADLLAGGAVPVVALAVLLAVRRARRRIARGEAEGH
jgi:uncharacterized membrane-anchored protein